MPNEKRNIKISNKNNIEGPSPNTMNNNKRTVHINNMEEEDDDSENIPDDKSINYSGIDSHLSIRTIVIILIIIFSLTYLFENYDVLEITGIGINRINNIIDTLQLLISYGSMDDILDYIAPFIILVIIFIIIIYYLYKFYKYCRRIYICKIIFNDIKKDLEEKPGRYMKEYELIDKYTDKCKVDRIYFKDEYLKELKNLAKNDSSVVIEENENESSTWMLRNQMSLFWLFNNFLKN